MGLNNPIWQSEVSFYVINKSTKEQLQICKGNTANTKKMADMSAAESAMDYIYINHYHHSRPIHN